MNDMGYAWSTPLSSHHQDGPWAQPVLSLLHRNLSIVVRSERQGIDDVIQVVVCEKVMPVRNLLHHRSELFLAQPRLATRDVVLCTPAGAHDGLADRLQPRADHVAFHQRGYAKAAEVGGEHAAEEPIDLVVPQRCEDQCRQEQVPDAAAHEASHEEQKLVTIVANVHKPFLRMPDREVEDYHQPSEQEKEDVADQRGGSPLDPGHLVDEAANA
mmetsp:Transcript_6803/g.18821  ORF Transcript_6803/g.18821 Transcript_6803/m.18821 type:complete len:214 (-) Transcript_6803:317-958(-)